MTSQTGALELELTISADTAELYRVDACCVLPGDGYTTGLVQLLTETRPQLANLVNTGSGHELLVGNHLFEALFGGRLREAYAQGYTEAQRLGVGLRLHVTIEPPELAELPWEYLADPHNQIEVQVVRTVGVTCLQCGQVARLGARFCRRCGTLLQQTKRLPAPTTHPLGQQPLTPLLRSQNARPRSTAPFATQPTLPGGATLGRDYRYRVERLLGRGGFGEAYLVRDIHLDRLCVIKRLVYNPAWSAETSGMVRESFQREAQLLVSLNTPGHPNIPDIYEYLPDEECLVMKYIAGQSLAQLMQERGTPLAEEEALRYARDICSALVYMHSRSPEPVLHRDVKPANILYDSEGRVWLIDFGLSRALPATAPLREADRSSGAGTIGYTPPEQWQGVSTPQSDVYALAATLFVLLTDYQPGTANALAIMRGEQALPRLRELAPAASAETERLLVQALTLNADERPTTQEFLAALDALLSRYSIPPPLMPARPPELAEFFGRTEELRFCTQVLQTRGVALISGLAGVGKSALAAQLAQRELAWRTVYWHSCLPDDGTGLIWSLANMLAWHEHTELWQRLQLARISGAQPPPIESQIDFVVRVLSQQNWLLVIDALHLLDDEPQMTRLLNRLANAAREGPLRLLLISRQTPAWLGSVTGQSLTGLDEEAAAALLAASELELSHELSATLVRTTGGNPQLLLLSADALRYATNPQQLIATLSTSDNIERYLLREVDGHLNDDERDLLGAIAALLGQSAPRDLIEALSDQPSVGRVLRVLSDRHLLTVGDEGHQRVYSLPTILQAFFYDQLSRRARLELHTRAAAWYASLPTEALQAARHYWRAGDATRAAELATSQVQAIINRGQARLLLNLLTHLANAPLDTGQRVATLLALGQTATLLGNRETAQAAYEQALGLLDTLPTEPYTQLWRAQACRGLGALLEYEEPREAIGWLQRGLDSLGATDQLEHGLLLLRIGSTQIGLGNYDEAAATLEESLALLPETPGHWRANALVNLGSIASSQGDYAQSRAYYNEALAHYEQAGDLWGMIAVWRNSAIDLEITGDWDGAEREHWHARAQADRLGCQADLAAIDLSLGILHTNRGDYAEAQEDLQRCIATARALRQHEVLSAGLLSLSDLLLRQEQSEAALPVLQEALVLIEEYGHSYQLPEAHRTKALVALAQGETGSAIEEATQAVALAEEVAQPLDHGCGLRVLGLALLANGQQAEGLVALRQSLALLDEQDPYESARTRAALGRALRGIGVVEGEELLHTAAATFTQLGARADLEARAI